MRNLIGILSKQTLFTSLFILAAITALTFAAPQNTPAQTNTLEAPAVTAAREALPV